MRLIIRDALAEIITMYQQNKQLELPVSNENIWRYMTFTKYVSLLSKRALFFCRVDKLGDKFEMASPLMNKQNDSKFYNEHRIDFFDKLGDEATEAFWVNVFSTLAPGLIINSWHRNKYESAAMWSVYSKMNEGIAIQSNVTRLCDCFTQTEDIVNVGVVNYIDYDSEKIENESIFGYVTHKRKSYEYENEIRAIISKQSDDNQIPLNDIGKYVAVDLSILVENVYIAPNTPGWYSELVEEIT